MGWIDFFYWYWSLADAYNRPSWTSACRPRGCLELYHLRSSSRLTACCNRADMPPSTRYSGSKQVPDLFTIDGRSWAIFVAYTQKNITSNESVEPTAFPHIRCAGSSASWSPRSAATGPQEHGPLEMESAVEDLGLPVRTLNVLRASGCKTIGDVLRLDLSAPVRGLGARSKKMLVEKLSLEGFSHPGAEEQPVSEIRWLERRLERIQRRVDLALGAVTKEISAAKQRLRRR